MSGSQATKHKKVLADESFGPDYCESSVAKTPIRLQEFKLLKHDAGLTADDEEWLRTAGEVLAQQTRAVLEKWRAVIAAHRQYAKDRNYHSEKMGKSPLQN